MEQLDMLSVGKNLFKQLDQATYIYKKVEQEGIINTETIKQETEEID